MPWAGGVYTRGYPSWSNDAANNLPISSSKFDIEDNDFASGLNNCLTKDGLNVPTGTLNWSQTNAIVMNLSRGSDGTIATYSRTGGSNNPQLQIVNADSTGISLNLSTNQTLSLSIAGTAVLALAAATATLNPTTTGVLGLAAVPVLTWTVGSVSLFNNVVAATAVLAITNTSTVATQDARLNIVGGSTAFSIYAANQNRATAVVTNGPTAAQAALFTTGAIPLVFGVNGTLAGTISSAGAWSLPAPTSGDTLTIAGLANAYGLTVNGNSTSGQSLGLRIFAGTTSADICFSANNQATTAAYLRVLGNGESFVFIPTNTTTVSTVAGCTQIGYVDSPSNVQNGNYTFLISDRGKTVTRSGATGPFTWTIPLNSATPFPIGTTIALVSLPGVSGVTNINVTGGVTLTWYPSGVSTGLPRILATTSAFATLYKVGTDSWVITGVGIS